MKWINDSQFIRDIDSLPKAEDWTCKLLTLEGDVLDANGRKKIEYAELWMKDVVTCVRSLMVNPMFRGNMAFKPERHYQGGPNGSRVYDEMWNSDWWWQTQVNTIPSTL